MTQSEQVRCADAARAASIPSRKSSHITEMIKGAILRGAYVPGDRIPTEQSLADTYGVSRNCIREALSPLRASGILHSTPGSGTYVQASSAPSWLAASGGKVAEKLERDLGETESDAYVLDIWEARMEIEATIAALATRTATGKSIRRIEYCIQQMEKALGEEDVERYLHAARAYHMAIARAADNRFLLEIITPLIEYTEIRLVEETGADRDRCLRRCADALEEHRAIAEGIKAGDPGAVADLLKAHFHQASEFYGSMAWEGEPT